MDGRLSQDLFDSTPFNRDFPSLQVRQQDPRALNDPPNVRCAVPESFLGVIIARGRGRILK